MKYIPLAARIFYGLIFFVFGLNYFFNFIPTPPNMPEKAAAFAGAMMQTGYMFPLIKLTEIVAGAMLLVGVAVPLALILLAPIVVNIVFFHLFLTPGEGTGMMVALVLLLLYLAYVYRDAYKSLFTCEGFLKK